MGGTKQRQVVLNCIRKKIQNRLRKTEKQASKQHPHSLCFSSGFQVLALNSALTSFSNRVLSESCNPFLSKLVLVVVFHHSKRNLTKTVEMEIEWPVCPRAHLI